MGIVREVELSCRTTWSPLEPTPQTRWLVDALTSEHTRSMGKVRNFMRFLFYFFSHLKPGASGQGGYANALDVACAKRTKAVESIASCSCLRCDTRMGRHELQGGINLYHGFEWGRGPPAWVRSRSSPGRSAAHHIL